MTASNFGRIIKKREGTCPTSIIKTILYPKSINTPAINYGKTKEHVAISHFEKVTGLSVRPSGLYVDVENGFLGASPDGW